MCTTNYNKGETYRVARIDTALEPVPFRSAFVSRPGEIFVQEPHPHLPYETVLENIQNGALDEFDFKVLSLIATFACTGVTFKLLWNLLYMSGEDLVKDDKRLMTSLFRLNRNSMTVCGRFKSPDRVTASNTRLIRLTNNGYKVGKTLGIRPRFNVVEMLDAPTAKTRLQLSALIVQLLKHLADGVEDFSVRPDYSRRLVDPNAVVRPGARVRLFGEDIFLEVLRSGTDDYLPWFTDKLRRYMMVFDEAPSLVINGESEEHNRLIHTYLSEHGDEHGFPLSNLLFTHDTALFGSSFRTCFYSFRENGDKVCFELAGMEPADTEFADGEIAAS